MGKCRICKKEGHNRNTCPPIPDNIVIESIVYLKDLEKKELTDNDIIA